MDTNVFYFVAERVLTRRRCTEYHRELLQITAPSFRAADQWLCANYKGWTHWHTDRPDKHLMDSTNFCAFTALA